MTCRRNEFSHVWQLCDYPGGSNNPRDIEIKNHAVPKNFFQTFKPFLDRKDKEDNRKREIHLSINGTLEKDRLVVAEYLSEYFSSMAKGIGGEQVDDLTEGNFIEHSSLHLIYFTYGRIK